MHSLHGPLCLLQSPFASGWHAVLNHPRCLQASAAEVFGCLVCVFMAPFSALAACTYQELLHDTGQLPALIAVLHAGHHPFFFSMGYTFENYPANLAYPIQPRSFLVALVLQLALAIT